MFSSVVNVYNTPNAEILQWEGWKVVLVVDSMSGALRQLVMLNFWAKSVLATQFKSFVKCLNMICQKLSKNMITYNITAMHCLFFKCVIFIIVTKEKILF